MKKIEKFKFGKMIIEGQVYNEDLIITPTKIYSNWWRKKGHLLTLEDIKDVWAEIESFRYFICGCGVYNMMKIDKEVFEKFKSLDILYFYGKTGDIVELYNSIVERGKSFVAAFHLSC